MKLAIAMGCAAVFAVVASAGASVRITEWMYAGSSGEFIEFTNTGNAAVDFTGWSFDDDSRTAGTVSLSAFGTVDPGESVVLTEAVASAFITDWSLTGVSVIGENATNLGRADEINIFDATNTLVDRLTYGDQTFAGTVRTQNSSGWAYVSGAGPFGNVDASWVLSSVNDGQASSVSLLGDTGNPGRYRAVPEPVSLTFIAGSLAALRRRR